MSHVKTRWPRARTARAQRATPENISANAVVRGIACSAEIALTISPRNCCWPSTKLAGPPRETINFAVETAQLYPSELGGTGSGLPPAAKEAPMSWMRITTNNRQPQVGAMTLWPRSHPAQV
eukprot:9483078-Pyramimonas_sp.AAC.2